VPISLLLSLLKERCRVAVTVIWRPIVVTGYHTILANELGPLPVVADPTTATGTYSLTPQART